MVMLHDGGNPLWTCPNKDCWGQWHPNETELKCPVCGAKVTRELTERE